MSKNKTRTIDRRRERRQLNANPETVKSLGHGRQTGWKRYFTRKTFFQRTKEVEE